MLLKNKEDIKKCIIILKKPLYRDIIDIIERLQAMNMKVEMLQEPLKNEIFTGSHNFRVYYDYNIFRIELINGILIDDEKFIKISSEDFMQETREFV